MTCIFTLLATAVVTAVFIGPAGIVAGYILGARDCRREAAAGPDLASYTASYTEGYEAGRREGWHAGWDAAREARARVEERWERARCN